MKASEIKGIYRAFVVSSSNPIKDAKDENQ